MGGFGGIPAFAAVLGAPYAVDKLVVDPIQSAYGLYKGIRDDQAQQNDMAQAKADLAAFAKDPTFQPDYSKYSDPTKALALGEGIKEQRKFGLEQAAAPTVDALQSFKAEGWSSDPSFSGNEWTQGLIDTMGVKTNPANPYERKAINDFAVNAQNEGTAVKAMQNIGGADRAALLKVYGGERLSPLLVDIQREETRASASNTANQQQANREEDRQSNAGFQSAIAGLTGRSTSPAELARFGKRAGLAPFAEVESDIRQAGAAYTASPEAIKAAVDDARQAYEKTPMGAPYTKSIGAGTNSRTALIQDFALGAPKVEMQQAAPTTIFHVREGRDGGGHGGGHGGGGGKKLPASAVDFFADTPMMISNLREAQALAPTVTTGPISGRAQNAASAFDGASDNFVNFQQKLSTVNNIMLKARSGAAVTEQEYRRFLKEMPTENDPPKKRDIKLANAIRYTESLVARKRKEYANAGYQIGEADPQDMPLVEQPREKPRPAGKQPVKPIGSFWK